MKMGMTIDEAIDRYSHNAEYERTHGNLQGCLEFRQLVDWLKDYKKLKEQEPCEDCVSRKAVRDTIFAKCSGENLDIDFAKVMLLQREIKAIPSVTPQEPKTGHWEFEKTVFDRFGSTVRCPSCHKRWKTYDEIRWEEENKYCPNCGCKMESKQEQESCEDCVNKTEIHCQYSDKEIAKSFIEDVETVKEFLPCGEQMEFPSTFDGER